MFIKVTGLVKITLSPIPKMNKQIKRGVSKIEKPLPNWERNTKLVLKYEEDLTVSNKQLIQKRV